MIPFILIFFFYRKSLGFIYSLSIVFFFFFVFCKSCTLYNYNKLDFFYNDDVVSFCYTQQGMIDYVQYNLTLTGRKEENGMSVLRCNVTDGRLVCL